MNLPAFLLWVTLFSVFTVGFLWPRRKRDWLSAGVLEGFLISLFFEMFGIPLTVYVLATLFGFEFSGGSDTTLFGVPPPFRVALLVIVLLLVAGGILLVMYGWRNVYRGKGQLVTDGPYAHVRHPQYVGILMVTFGLIVWWPTVITAIMWPILAFMYFRLARREEEEMRKEFGEAYDEYCKRVRMFLPVRKRENSSTDSEEARLRQD
ncbi:MAG: methyltransferase family protein [Thermoplasmata archaeon]